MRRRFTPTDRHHGATVVATSAAASRWSAIVGSPGLGGRQAGVELELDVVGDLQGPEQN
jgi:hypothetical protein